MSVKDRMNTFLDLFGEFEECIDARQTPEQVTDRRNRISLFGIYMVTHREE